MSWDPQHYLSFADERTRPAAELVARIDCAVPRRVIDLGCGPGNSTALAVARWPNAAVEGLDSSPEMIASAKESRVHADFFAADIASWRATAPYDVIISNATLNGSRITTSYCRAFWVFSPLEAALRFRSPAISTRHRTL